MKIFRNTKIKIQLLICFLLVIVIFFGTIAVALLGMRNLSSSAKDINTLVISAGNHNLSYRSDVNTFEGDWRKIIEGFNGQSRTTSTRSKLYIT